MEEKMTFGTMVRILSAVLVLAGLMGAADNPKDIPLGLHVAAVSFFIFSFAVLIKIEGK